MARLATILLIVSDAAAYSRPPLQSRARPLVTAQPRCCAEPPEDDRANNVAAAPLAYAAVLPLQAVALVDATWAHFAYFLAFATLTVHLGATAAPIRDERPPEFTLQQAIVAPFAASALLLGLYFLITYYNVDPSTAYRLSVCTLGIAAMRDIAVQAIAATSLLRDGSDVASPPPPPSATTRDNDDDERASLFNDAERTCALVLALVLVGDYALAAASGSAGGTATGTLPSPFQLIEQNLIAWSLAMFSISTVSLRTFKVASVFLLGLFAYDIVWVFSSDVVSAPHPRHRLTYHARHTVSAPLHLPRPD